MSVSSTMFNGATETELRTLAEKSANPNIRASALGALKARGADITRYAAMTENPYLPKPSIPANADPLMSPMPANADPLMSPDGQLLPMPQAQALSASPEARQQVAAAAQTPGMLPGGMSPIPPGGMPPLQGGALGALPGAGQPPQQNVPRPVNTAPGGALGALPGAGPAQAPAPQAPVNTAQMLWNQDTPERDRAMGIMMGGAAIMQAQPGESFLQSLGRGLATGVGTARQEENARAERAMLQRKLDIEERKAAAKSASKWKEVVLQDGTLALVDETTGEIRQTDLKGSVKGDRDAEYERIIGEMRELEANGDTNSMHYRRLKARADKLTSDNPSTIINYGDKQDLKLGSEMMYAAAEAYGSNTQLIHTLNRMQDLIVEEGVRTGPLEPAIASMTGIATNLGIDAQGVAKEMGITLNDQTSANDMQRLLKELTLQVGRQFFKGQGHVSNMEQQLLDRAMANFGTDTKANLRAIWDMRTVARLGQERYEMMSKFYEENPDKMHRFPAVWDEYVVGRFEELDKEREEYLKKYEPLVSGPVVSGGVRTLPADVDFGSMSAEGIYQKLSSDDFSDEEAARVLNTLAQRDPEKYKTLMGLINGAQ